MDKTKCRWRVSVGNDSGWLDTPDGVEAFNRATNGARWSCDVAEDLDWYFRRKRNAQAAMRAFARQGITAELLDAGASR